MRQVLISCLFLVSVVMLTAQETSNINSEEISYQKCLELYNEGAYAAASQLLLQYIDQQEYSNNINREENVKKASLIYAKSAVKMDKLEGEKLILNFVNRYAPDPVAAGAMGEMAEYYFNKRNYQEASRYYNQMNLNNLSKKEREEVQFKKAYLLFVQKKFDKAKSMFSQVKNGSSDYRLAANYYYGLCCFYKNDYENAIKSFNQVQSSNKYKKYIPYYTTQIYFKQKRYDELIRYGENALKADYDVRNRNEINQLIGQSYFELADYTAALPYYEFFMERMSQLRAEDFYQAGFVYYQNAKYEKARRYFEQISDDKTALGQNGLFHLADCYLKLGDKASARNAFYKSSILEFDRDIQSESQFQHAKLSLELGYENEALETLTRIESNSPNYAEAQRLMSDLFLRTNNFKKAEKILKGMSTRSVELNEAYHQVLYYRGIEELGSGNKTKAKEYFSIAAKNDYSRASKVKSSYWLADIAHSEKKYQESNNYLNQFLRTSSSVSLDETTSEGLAYYLLGYNHTKLGNYPAAKREFGQSISRIQSKTYSNSYIPNQILPDAHIRLGDCYFKENNYNEALNNYNKVRSNNKTNYVYVLYQKALIKGLTGNRVDKVIELEKIANNYPNSQYADDALYELGVTYLEIGQLNKGREPLEQLVRKYKSSSEWINQAYLKLGLVAYNQGGTRKAIEHYTSCLDNNPTPIESQNALIALREIYVDDLGDPESYFKLQEKYTGYKYSESGKDSLNYRVAEKQFEEGNYNGAIREFGSYIRKYPKGVFIIPAYFFRGECHFINEDYDNAYSNYEYIFNRGRSKYYEEALLKAALIAYNHKEDFEKSLNYYRQLNVVAQSNELKFKAQIGAMRSAYKTGDTEQIKAMARLVIENPLANNDQKGTAYYYLAKVNMDNGDFGPAENYYGRTAELLSNEYAAEARYSLAEIEYQKGNLPSAKSKCSSANKSNTSFPYWLAKGVILLSDILKDEGDYFNAKAVLQSLLENYEGDEQLIAIAKAKLERLNQLDKKNIIRGNTNKDVLEMEDSKED